MENGDKIKNSALPAFAVGIVEFIYYIFASRISAEGRVSNIRLYIIGSLIFGAAVVLITVLQHYVRIKETKNIEITLGAAALVWGIVFFCKAYDMENLGAYGYAYKYLRHAVPAAIYALVFVIFCLIWFFALRSEGSKKARFRLFVSIGFAFVQALFLYAPNPFKDSCGQLYHIDAYTNSIINALSYAPLEQYSTSVYGHYAVFFIIPVKLLTLLGVNQWNAVTLCMAVIGGVTVLLECIIINKLVKSDTLFLLTVSANAAVAFQIYYDQFYQVLPHRIIFQAIILYILLRLFDASDKKLLFYKRIGWIMAALAIVWNTETGIVCAIVFMLGAVLTDAKNAGKWSFISIVKNAAFLAGSAASAYLFVNLYNIIVGGNFISPGVYIYPIGSSTYPLKEIQILFQQPWGGYFAVILVTLGAIAYLFGKMLSIRLTRNEYMLILASVMGYGVFLYYMNRAYSTNASVAAFVMVLILGVICDSSECIKTETSFSTDLLNIRFIVPVFCLAILSSMALSAGASFGSTLNNKLTSTYETASLEEFKQTVAPRIPENTVAFGMGTAQLFSCLDRQTGIYMADWEDLNQSFTGASVINPEADEYIRNALQENRYEYILVNAEQENYIPSNYTEIDTFEYVYTFKLYQRNV